MAGGVMALLSGMKPDKAEPRGEVYTLGTGSTFKVTPIFDPSGQALRFKFDYVGLTNIREPDGTTNRALPRVDRHTVNTEVQLSNLELREISRFEATSQIGVPPRRYGGIPFLKDLPAVKEIPILGYFSKQEGRAAVQQENVILGQTTIFPSVSEIVDLLVDVPPSRTLERRMPSYLLQDSDAPPAKADAGDVDKQKKSLGPLLDEARELAEAAQTAVKQSESSRKDAETALTGARGKLEVAAAAVQRELNRVLAAAEKPKQAFARAKASAAERDQALALKRAALKELEAALERARCAKPKDLRAAKSELAAKQSAFNSAVETAVGKSAIAAADAAEAAAVSGDLLSSQAELAEARKQQSAWQKAVSAAEAAVLRWQETRDEAALWESAAGTAAKAGDGTSAALERWRAASGAGAGEAKASVSGARAVLESALAGARSAKTRYGATLQTAEAAKKAALEALNAADKPEAKSPSVPKE